MPLQISMGIGEVQLVGRPDSVVSARFGVDHLQMSMKQGHRFLNGNFHLVAVPDYQESIFSIS